MITEPSSTMKKLIEELPELRLLARLPAVDQAERLSEKVLELHHLLEMERYLTTELSRKLRAFAKLLHEWEERDRQAKNVTP